MHHRRPKHRKNIICSDKDEAPDRKSKKLLGNILMTVFSADLSTLRGEKEGFYPESFSSVWRHLSTCKMTW